MRCRGKSDWDRGVVKASAQNVARRFTDAPANRMTPTIFSDDVRKLFEGKPKVEVIVRFAFFTFQLYYRDTGQFLSGFQKTGNF